MIPSFNLHPSFIIMDESKTLSDTGKRPSVSRFKVAKVGFAGCEEPAGEEDASGDQPLNIDCSAKLAPDQISPPNSPLTDRDLTYTDTHNLKTFGHNTHEALPHEDHYRNLLSATHALRSRPTLEELHGQVSMSSFLALQ